jgi:putative tricarboxylic transport membrane protein
MRRPHLIAASLLIALALFVGWESLRLTYYSPLGPGPGFFAFWLSVCLAAASLGMAVEAWRSAPQALPADFLPGRAGLLKIAAIVGALIVTMAVFEPLGFRLTMLALVGFLLVVLGQRSLVVTPIVALLASFGVYELFVHALGVPLPIGALGI